MSRSRRLSVHLACACLVLAACGGGGGDEDDATPTTTEPSTTESQEARDEAALRQLAENWYATYNRIFETQATADDAHDLLVDPYLQQFEQQVEDYLASGNRTTRSEASGHVIEEVTVDGDRGLIIECVVNGNVLVDAEGNILNDDVAVRRLETEAVRVDGAWRLSNRRVAEELNGESCDG